MRSMMQIVRYALVVGLLCTGFVVYGLSTASPVAHASCPTIPSYQTFGFNMWRTSYNPSECLVTPATSPTLAWVDTFAGMKLGAREGISTFNSLGFIGLDQALIAFNTFTGATVWSFPTGNVIEGAATVHQGTIYFASTDARFYALNPGGGLICSQLLSAPILTTPAAVQGVVVVSTKDGVLYGLNATTCAIMWTNTLGVALSSPSVFSNFAFVSAQISPTQSMVFVLNAWTGTIVSASTAFTATFTAPVVTNDLIYVGAVAGASGGVLALKMTSPTLTTAWITGLGDRVFGKPAVDGSQVYVVTAASSRLYALNAFTGAIAWSTLGLCGALYTAAAPTVANGGVYVGAASCISAYTTSGVSAWAVPLSSIGDAPVTVINGWLYTTAYGPGTVDRIFAYKA